MEGGAGLMGDAELADRAGAGFGNPENDFLGYIRYRSSS